MPNPGQVNNGSGANGFTGPGGVETPYGAVKRLGQMTKAAPIGTAPGANAPQQAKRAAQGGAPQEPPPVTPDQQVMGAQLPYPVVLANAWAAIAATPGASPLVQQMAAAAAQAVQRGV